MDSSLALRSFHYTAGCVSHAPERIGLAPAGRSSRSFISSSSSSSSSSSKRTAALLVSCLKAPEAAAKSGDGAVEKRGASRTATFPASFESLLEEVCDETEIAELKLKIGGFEMHLKRNIEAPAPPPSISQIALPVPAVEVSAPVAASSPAASPKPSEKASHFINESFGRSPRLDALEASGVSGYVLVASPMVGTFLSSKEEKGVKNPPLIKEGSKVRKGQVIGFMDQFGKAHRLRSDAAGKVIKVFFDDGEPVGFGEPLIAVMP